MEKELIKLLNKFEKYCHNSRKHDQYEFSLSGFHWWLKQAEELDKLKIPTPIDEEKKKLNSQIISLMLLFKPVNERIDMSNMIQRNTLK